MTEPSLSEIVRTGVHARVLRYLFATREGLDLSLLEPEENRAADELAELGVVQRDGERLVLTANYAGAEELRDRVRPRSIADRNWRNESGEIERLRAEHREMGGLLVFMQAMLNTIIRSRTVAELFHSAFKRLSNDVPFDVGVALMLEQNLDVYLSKSSDHEKLVNDRLIGEIRATLHSQIPVSFVSTDVVIQGDFSDLPMLSHGADPLGNQVHSLLKQDGRTAGIVILYRGGSAFTMEEQRILEILADQAAMVLGNIRAQEQIQNLADTDDLTGIWNKRYFRRLLPSEVERAKIYSIPLSLVLFDVDNFKGINDTFGHVMGDVLLSELCGTVRDSLRPPDLFARFGGDEFAIILPHTDLWGARAVSERIVQRVRALNVFQTEDGAPVRTSISMGLATLTPQDGTANDLITRADDRLYLSKKSGKDRYSW